MSDSLSKAANELHYLSYISSNVSSIRDSLQAFMENFNEFFTFFQMFLVDYFPPSAFAEEIDISVYNGWHNFFEAFKDMSLHDYIMNIHKEIENQVNPLSEDNAADFNAAIDTLKNDTVIGDLNAVSDAGNQILNSLGSANPTATLSFNTLPGEICGISIPSYSIDVDFSWYGAYREQAHRIMSAFMWISWVVLMWRRLPAIINGAPMDIFNQRDDIPDTITTEHITVDDNGEVTSHRTVNRHSDGTVVTQIHKGDK